MMNNIQELLPTQPIDVSKLFGIKSNIKICGFENPMEYVPSLDEVYQFDQEVTQAILVAVHHNRRLLISGRHGTGKSTHIEQVAARLNWPCIRINLDSQLTRIDLVGRDTVILEKGLQVTKFQEGLIPWALQRPCFLVLDEYDAARPEVLFVIQRLLESDGDFTLPEQSKIIKPHPFFRLFATSNTVGFGDQEGIYHGTQILNQGQMDRWNLVAKLDRLRPEKERAILLAKLPQYHTKKDIKTLENMIIFANLTRDAFANDDLAISLSPRSVLNWAENALYFERDVAHSFCLSFMNRCTDDDKLVLNEFFQRCFNVDLIHDK